MSFEPHPLLRNPHVQSFLGASTLRKWRVRRVYGTALDVVARETVLDCGDGVRLQAWISEPLPAPPPDRPVVILLHGWEGSVDSAYIRAPAAYLFARGYTIVRLNFRDHGATHHLNPGLFHGCRLDEVVGAVGALADRFAPRPLALVGFSMGGNFALRVALRAPDVGQELDRVIAVNPTLCPAVSTAGLDTGPALYRRYFLRKWRRSLRRKQVCFPDRYDFRDLLRYTSIMRMSEVVVQEHTPFDSLEAYFEGYTVTPAALATLPVPSTIIMAEDDPIVPPDHVRALPPLPNLTVDMQVHGGHCGYITDFRLRAWIERRLWNLLQAPAAAAR